MNQSQFLAITCNLLEAQKKSRVHGAMGFCFDSHWLKNWRESFKPITKRSNRNHVITFDSHLKTALSRQIRHVFNVGVYERGLNDAINYAQRGLRNAIVRNCLALYRRNSSMESFNRPHVFFKVRRDVKLAINFWTEEAGYYTNSKLANSKSNCFVVCGSSS